MNLKKILWLEDESENFSAFRSALFRAGYLVDTVKSVSDAVKKLKKAKENYAVVIFDIKVLPGDAPDWIKIDRENIDENRSSDSYLGLELLYSLFNSPIAKVKIEPSVKIDPKKVIVFSVVSNRTEDIAALGIPEYQILYKSTSDPKNLLQLIKNILSKNKGEKNKQPV
jgi:CheY-like chemotaxis protein